MTDISAEMLDNRVVKDSISFVQSITERYGSDKGMAIWTVMTEQLDPKIKEQVFLAMLTGKAGRTSITIKQSPGNNNNVAGIKAIRYATQLGLREAKTLWDRSKIQPVDINCTTVAETMHLREVMLAYSVVAY